MRLASIDSFRRADLDHNSEYDVSVARTVGLTALAFSKADGSKDCLRGGICDTSR